MKESLEAKTLVGKFKDCVDDISAASSSITKSISKIKTTVAAANKVEDQVASKSRSLNKWSSGDAGVQ